MATIKIKQVGSPIRRTGDQRATLIGLTTRPAQRPPGAQGLAQLTTQPAAALDVERLVDRLV